MSEPAKSPEEIEDVLASIRRLVSGPATPPASDRDRLVLTAALRVTEPDDPWGPVPPAAPAPGPQDSADATAGTTDPDSPEEGGGAALTWALEDRLGDWGEISTSAAEAVSDALSDGDSDPATEDAAPILFSRRRTAQHAASLGDFEPETGDADWPDAGADEALRALVLARAQPDPDAPPREDGPQHAPDPATDAQDNADDAPAVTTPSPAPEAAPSTESLGTACESADPGDATDVSDHGDDMDDRDTDEIEDLGQSPSTGFAAANIGVLDEDTLREIVAEVVRQELQGALGERITRNIRKMVRREIRLALALDDLD